MPVNEINSYRIQEWVEFSDPGLADSIIAEVTAASQILDEVKGLLERAGGYSATWEGDAKGIHDDLLMFCDWYTNDIPTALTDYIAVLKVLSEELNSLATESTVLQKFKNVTEI